MHAQPVLDKDAVIHHTKHWLECAVIGLNLCPFAKAVHVKGQIHYAITDAVEWATLIDVVRVELQALMHIHSQERDTSLVIMPQAFPDFLSFNDFLRRADQLLCEMNLDGEFQIASFHPQYQFAEAAQDDMTNYTNRAPYPTLHLLREASIDRAVLAFPQAESIYEANIATMKKIGIAGWTELGIHTVK